MRDKLPSLVPRVRREERLVGAPVAGQGQAERDARDLLGTAGIAGETEGERQDRPERVQEGQDAVEKLARVHHAVGRGVHRFI